MHKHTQRHTPMKPASNPPLKFFERELAGEEAPSFETMQALYERATQIHMRAPWNDLDEDELVVFKEPFTKEHCYCSVMGALGEARALQIYVGATSYFWFRKMHQGHSVAPSEFFAHQRSIFVHYIPAEELDKPDRDLVKIMGHPLAKGTVAPVFRAVRPGYHPWFVTESEARVLTTGMEAILAVCDLLTNDPKLDLWDIADVYPLVTLERVKDRRQKYRVSEVDAPPALTPTVPALDLKRTQSILERKLPHRGILEVDHFFSEAMIGEKHARKACLRIALAIDAKTNFAFPPELGSPEDSTGEILYRLVLGAIDAMEAIPSKIHVRDRDFKSLLAPLAKTLGFEIAVKPSLPALEFAKSEMQAMLSGQGL